MTTMPPPPQPAPQYGGYPPGYPPPGPPAPPRRAGTPTVLGLLAVAAMVIGLSVQEDGASQWSRVHAWGALAIAAAVLTLAPVFGRSMGMPARRAAELAGVGAGGLVLFWVLFTLPYVGTNTSLVATVGVAAGCAAVWTAPDRAAHPLEPRGW